MRRPFMASPAQLTSLEGQQYLVLRPTGAVAAEYQALQRETLAALDTSVTFPHTGHVTLRGFAESGRLEELTAVIRTWAERQHPITVSADAVDTFAGPWQIVILRLARTDTLVSAYAALTDLLVHTDFLRLGELDLEDWTFHLSVVYGKTLDANAWDELDRAARRPLPALPTEIITEAELVWYQDGIEHAEVIPLGRP
ncbi:2'-5' RNA ligase family protein [Microbacterium sp. LWO12-1.2]|uniref:2'-5' RNA ligase family protein n=1 Tax=Microbacterium sp. LWO12-1.2 TaxID=3135261 RepID=UPI003426E5DF